MNGLNLLRNLVDPADDADPTDRLLEVGKSLQQGADVAKRKTPDTVSVNLDDLQVDPDYQRPPDREKIAEFVRHLRGGGDLPPLEVNVRPDGSKWITDGQHRAAARAICGQDTAQATLTYRPRQEEPQMTGIMKVAETDDSDAIGRLLALGGRRDGKRLVVELGAAGTVSYLPHAGEFVSKTERGTLTVDARDPDDVIKALDLHDLTLEIP